MNENDDEYNPSSMDLTVDFNPPKVHMHLAHHNGTGLSAAHIDFEEIGI